MLATLETLSNVMLAVATAGVTGSAFVLALELGAVAHRQAKQYHASRCARKTCLLHRHTRHV